MRFKVVAVAFAAVAAIGLVVAPADAAPKKKRVMVVDARGNTVFTSRDEDGRSRTRVIIQKRSYLDPGTERFPGENSDHGYAYLPTHSPTSIFDNTAFGSNRSPLPGPFDLPGRNNPSLRF